MLVDMKEKLMSENSLFKPYSIWTNYQVLDNKNVEVLDTKYNVNALTNYIPLCNYAMRKSERLNSLFGQYLKRYNLYLGMSQRTLNEDQEKVMKRVSEYIINDGAISSEELNVIDADLWRNGVNAFKNIQLLSNEMNTLAKFILKVA
jgi:type I restriction enzyme R subunit